MATKKKHPVIALVADVKIEAAKPEEKKLPHYAVTFYNGGALEINGWDLPVVVDLAGLRQRRNLVANLDHETKQRIGNPAVTNDGKSLSAEGDVTAVNSASKELVDSAVNGYRWEASLEVDPHEVEHVKSGQTAEANGQTFDGPLYVTREGVLRGFAFVGQGADEDTEVDIAAIAASRKEKSMSTTLEPKFQAWIEESLPGLDIEAAKPEVIASLKADYEGKQNASRRRTPAKLDDIMAEKQAEIDRQDEITEIAAKACDARPYDIDNIKALAAEAIEQKHSVKDFRLALFEAAVPPGHTVMASRGKNRLDDKTLEAAVLMAGRYPKVEKEYPEQVLEAANKRFRHGIGLKELFVLAAQANGYNNGGGYNVDIDVQRAAFGMTAPRIRAAADFSTISLPNVFSNVSNKFLRMGWDAVDQTPLNIAAIRPVNDFKEITTISLTGGLLFQEVGPGGELTHGSVGEETYGNKVKTRGILFSITRENIINDDLGALTQIPKRIGRGGMLTLNHVFWTEFLNPTVANFWHSNNANVNTGVADMTTGGLSATEVIFMNQTDPDGNPLLSQPAILLVPTALKHAARTLMTSENLIDGTATGVQGSKNIWQGRFRVESSPYMSNSAYTGFDAAAWYMLADPNDIPVIEIAALNGRVEPIVETADADFNVLGVRMRGYDDIGVRVQEPRGGVRADGGSS